MLIPDQPVRVFRNWKQHCYSLMQGGIVRASAREVLLADVEFLVRDSGRRRMLASGRKNVHAYAIGTLVDFVHPESEIVLPALAGRGVIYDARRFASFVDSVTHLPVANAEFAHLHGAGVTYQGWPQPLAA